MQPTPPRLADRLLRLMCAPHLREEVLGDLHERYVLWAQQSGEANAQRRYWREMLAYLRPSIMKRQPTVGMLHHQHFGQYPNPTTTDMLRNYLKIAFRNLTRNKVSSFINIGGLAVGMAVAILIGLWIYDELSFNKYHKNYDRIAQVMQHQTINGETFTGPAIPIPLANELRTAYGDNFKHILLSPGQRGTSYRLGIRSFGGLVIISSQRPPICSR